MTLLADATSVEVVRTSRRRRAHRRQAVLGLLAAATVAAFFTDVLLGGFTVTIGDFVRIVSGADIPGASFVVMADQLPKAVIGLLVGGCLGMSGAVFQTMLRNPLASPDIIGVTAGASCAGVFATVVLGLAGTALSLAAFVGTVAVALLIHVLARREGAGQRLVLIGVGVAAMLQAGTSFLLTRADLHSASEALVWLTGSLNNADWDGVTHLVAALVVLLPLVWLASRTLTGLELGDEVAAGVGVSVGRARLGLLLVAVALAAVAVAAAGPVAFVAFMAGPIARRLLGGDTSLAAAGLVGALIVLCAQFAATNAIPQTPLPVGVVTGAMGAPFLMYLLVAANRGGRGG